uniref:Uncharacterized protein n=1 Tax=Candidatus Kentrum sp. MB TaxID=2138164 RepID=A0A450XU94_9GAMM|nr:MAG: hypothetical protein BECKMB1821G_GA0114241_10377 [Candidatus Kentron sp. MB]VFK32839.1 MAG: hypothetical protein BECKMB1821I_GA0114274_10376 [Candidatus Kentron sp. MB]VFK75942.1 MAG: hypothetical protein BECKMB1821H_GA0114242_103621 [Candidatus Kentron sp. MB]
MSIRLTEQESIRVMNGEGVFAIMQRVLLREKKIDRDKERFWIIGLDADSRILFIATRCPRRRHFRDRQAYGHVCNFSWTILFRNNTIRIRIIF